MDIDSRLHLDEPNVKETRELKTYGDTPAYSARTPSTLIPSLTPLPNSHYRDNTYVPIQLFPTYSPLHIHRCP